MIEIQLNTPPSTRPPAIDYLEYANLLAHMIAGRAVPQQREQVRCFEQEQPQHCPHCGIHTRSLIRRERVIHDIAMCPKRLNN